MSALVNSTTASSFDSVVLVTAPEEGQCNPDNVLTLDKLGSSISDDGISFLDHKDTNFLVGRSVDIGEVLGGSICMSATESQNPQPESHGEGKAGDDEHPVSGHQKISSYFSDTNESSIFDTCVKTLISHTPESFVQSGDRHVHTMEDSHSKGIISKVDMCSRFSEGSFPKSEVDEISNMCAKDNHLHPFSNVSEIVDKECVDEFVAESGKTLTFVHNTEVNVESFAPSVNCDVNILENLANDNIQTQTDIAQKMKTAVTEGSKLESIDDAEQIFDHEGLPPSEHEIISLVASDLDRQFEAWIPCKSTQHILESISAGSLSSSVVQIEQMSCPSIINEESQGDPVRELVCSFLGKEEALRRQVLKAESVTQDWSGLQKLVDCGCFRAALDLTCVMLSSCGQGVASSGKIAQHTPDTLQLWSLRFALMTKLCLYEMAVSEMKAFLDLDTPDLYFVFYPQLYPRRNGCMVPFSMRLVYADLPRLTGHSQETLDRLCSILVTVRKIISNLRDGLREDGSEGLLSCDSRQMSGKLWQEREVRVLLMIANTLLHLNDYRAALKLYEDILNSDTCLERANVLAAIGRVYLQMGNLTKAGEVMKEIEGLLPVGETSTEIHNAMNRGLLAVCSSNFTEAYGWFKSAVQLDPGNICAANNMAVSSLYMIRLKDALETLESAVLGNPARSLHEGTLFNLSTFYELESSQDLHKKIRILDLVSSNKGDGFPVACLKMA